MCKVMPRRDFINPAGAFVTIQNDPLPSEPGTGNWAEIQEWGNDFERLACQRRFDQHERALGLFMQKPLERTEPYQPLDFRRWHEERGTRKQS